MCLWDVYKAEVESGHLEWGIIHSEKFFKDHAMRLEGKNGDFELVRMLVMLAAGDDEDVAAVACYDLGEFVRQYPNGRAIAKRLGAKDIVMQLIESDNEELKRHALQCVSKIMVQNWAVSFSRWRSCRFWACFLVLITYALVSVPYKVHKMIRSTQCVTSCYLMNKLLLTLMVEMLSDCK